DDRAGIVHVEIALAPIGNRIGVAGGVYAPGCLHQVLRMAETSQRRAWTRTSPSIGSLARRGIDRGAHCTHAATLMCAGMEAACWRWRQIVAEMVRVVTEGAKACALSATCKSSCP